MRYSGVMRIRDRFRGSRTERAGTAAPRTKTATADAVRAYKRSGQSWTYSDGRIYVDGYDVGEMIADDEATVSTLIGVASGLDDYKKLVQRRPQRVSGAPRFIALVDALLEKVLGRVKSIYDDKIFGVSWQLKGDALIVNGINVSSFLALYRVRKTEKARNFLLGLRQKVESLIANPAGSMRNERARRTLLALKRDIDAELEKDMQTALPGRMLPAGDSRR